MEYDYILMVVGTVGRRCTKHGCDTLLVKHPKGVKVGPTMSPAVGVENEVDVPPRAGGGLALTRALVRLTPGRAAPHPRAR